MPYTNIKIGADHGNDVYVYYTLTWEIVGGDYAAPDAEGFVLALVAAIQDSDNGSPTVDTAYLTEESLEVVIP